MLARKSDASVEAESLIEKYRLKNPDNVAATDYEDDDDNKNDHDDHEKLEKCRTIVLYIYIIFKSCVVSLFYLEDRLILYLYFFFVGSNDFSLRCNWGTCFVSS